MFEECTRSDVASIVPGLQLHDSILSRIERLRWYRMRHITNELPYDETLCVLYLAKLQKLGERLVLNPLIKPPPSIRREFNALGSSDEMVTRVFGSIWKPRAVDRSPVVADALETVREQTALARASEIALRIELETHYRNYTNWYPVMNTLTVNAGEHDKVFYGDKSAWRLYLKRWTNAIGSAVCGSVKAFKRSNLRPSDVHSYAAVTERGDKLGRLHIHVLHFCKCLPEGFTDPNRNQSYPDKREIAFARRYWPHGFSTPTAVRFHGNDIFARLGWVWPVENRGGVTYPLKANPPRAVAIYMADYLTKSYLKKEKDAWRTKLSRNYGKTIIQQAIAASRNTTLRHVLSNLQTSEMLPKVNGTKLPPQLIRRLAIKEMLRRRNASRQSKNSSMKLNTHLTELKRQPSLMKKLGLMTRGHIMAKSAHQNSMSIATGKLMSMGISDAVENFEMVWNEYEINSDAKIGSGKHYV